MFGRLARDTWNDIFLNVGRYDIFGFYRLIFLQALVIFSSLSFRAVHVARTILNCVKVEWYVDVSTSLRENIV